MEEFLRPQELLIILVIVLVLFGGAKLPELARNLGRAQRELKAGFREGAEPDSTDEPAAADTTTPDTTTPDTGALDTKKVDEPHTA